MVGALMDGALIVGALMISTLMTGALVAYNQGHKLLKINVSGFAISFYLKMVHEV